MLDAAAMAKFFFWDISDDASDNGSEYSEPFPAEQVAFQEDQSVACSSISGNSTTICDDDSSMDSITTCSSMSSSAAPSWNGSVQDFPNAGAPSPMSDTLPRAATSPKAATSTAGCIRFGNSYIPTTSGTQEVPGRKPKNLVRVVRSSLGVTRPPDTRNPFAFGYPSRTVETRDSPASQTGLRSLGRPSYSSDRPAGFRGRMLRSRSQKEAIARSTLNSSDPVEAIAALNPQGKKCTRIIISTKRSRGAVAQPVPLAADQSNGNGEGIELIAIRTKNGRNAAGVLTRLHTTVRKNRSKQGTW